MYNLMDSNIAFLVAFFFTMIVVVGSFFLLNMILAVIMGSFTAMEELERQKQEAKKVNKLYKS